MEIEPRNRLDDLFNTLKRAPNYRPTAAECSLITWFERAATLRGVTARMAAYLRKRAMETGHKVFIRIGPKQFEEAGIPRASGYEALNELAAAGLIKFNANKRRTVSIVEIDDDSGIGTSRH